MWSVVSVWQIVECKSLAAYDGNILYALIAEKLIVWFWLFQVKDRDSNTPLLGHQDRESEVKKLNKDSLVWDVRILILRFLSRSFVVFFIFILFLSQLMSVKGGDSLNTSNNQIT